MGGEVTKVFENGPKILEFFIGSPKTTDNLLSDKAVHYDLK